MNKKIIYLILISLVVLLSIGYKSIAVDGGNLREDNNIWSKSPNMSITLTNYSILPKSFDITILNIKNESLIKNNDETKVINPNEKIVLTLPPLSQKSYSIGSSDSKKLKYAVVGDSRHDNLDEPYSEVFKKIMEDIDIREIDFVIHVGDFVMEPTEKGFEQFENIISQYSTPVYTVIGNHELGIDRRYLYQKYFGDTYYSFIYMGKKFIFLDNSVRLLNEENILFLEEELDFQGEKFIFMHMPPFDPRPSGTHDMFYGDEFIDKVKDNNVSIVFTGHVHMYYKTIINDTKYIITGGGGSPLYTSEARGGFHHYIIYDEGKINLIRTSD